MVNVVLNRFQHCFGPFTILLVEGYSEKGLFRNLPNPFFAVRKFKNTSALRVTFFLKIFQIESKFRKCKKKFRQYFSLLR